ncbi:DUF6805 domain-containing protein [Paenibacillus sp. RC67]|uniref:DUF6805 domain-containing protein n=1 Tax=Paenibacillus sp. RC67 TaxID=3039392 RepID=UPI0024ADEA03|nr:DUF6805 domain-containing protein [Paenibacillus sp. RC67]
MSIQNWLDQFDQHFIRKSDEFAFVLRNTDEDGRLVFTPHYKQHRKRYGIYWRVIEQDSSEFHHYMEKCQREQALRDATIDSVQVGNDQYELQHQVKGERTHAVTWEGLNGRRAEPDGWFSYDLKVQPDEVNGLAITFGRRASGRLEIWVNDQILSEEEFVNVYSRSFYEKTYPLSTEMIAGQTSITVKFVPIGGCKGIYGILRTLKL